MTKEPTEAQVWHSRYMAAQIENAKLRAALDRLYWYAERLEGVVYGQGNAGELEVMKETRAALGGDA